MEPKLDCRFYIGEKPCRYKRLCHGCTDYSPMGVRVLILKLGAMGDALRTTPILTGIQRKYQTTHITWVTDTDSFPVLEDNPLIDRLIINRPEETIPLLSQEFEWVICLDKDPSVLALAMQVTARHRSGFAMSPYGTLDIFNEASRYSLALGLDDDLKFFKNRKSYQEIVFEMIELPYERDDYVFNLLPENKMTAQRILSEETVSGKGPNIGLNTGCGDVFATKKWPDTHFIELAKQLHQHYDARIHLLGGPSEVESNINIQNHLGFDVANPGARPLGVFAGLLGEMDLVIASDTMALHLGLAVGTRVIGMFGPTCHQEIDFYDRGEPVIMRCDCSPCYRKTCRHSESCMSKLSPIQVLKTVEKYITSGKRI